ncbi:MAG: hypothetical protein RL509_1136, partial [Pseudomonadota bacterium]
APPYRTSQALQRLACWPLRRPPGGRSLAYWKPGPGTPGRAAPGRGRRIAGPGPWSLGRELQAVGRYLVRARNSPSCANRAREPAPGLGPGPLTRPPGRRPGARYLVRAAARSWALGRGPCALVRVPCCLLPGARAVATAPGAGGESRRAFRRAPRPRFTRRETRPACDARRPWPDFAQLITP